MISLGLAPNKNARVTTAASAVLMDVNDGYVYTVVTGSGSSNQITNAWESAQAMDDARRRAERQAFEQLVSQFRNEWPNVLKTYDHSGGGISP